jgi:hypothetical protein
MKRALMFCTTTLAVLALSGTMRFARADEARPLTLEVSTDKGEESIYEPGDPLQVRVHLSDAAYLLVYEIDSQGYVHLLYPVKGQSVEARQNYEIPSQESDAQLVVQAPTGQDYIVGIAARTPFENLPWYLRPYNAQGESIGYVNQPAEEEGMTSDGKIVGDPFVAMERIRRRVLAAPNDAATFATAYTTYYVHQQVKYPRYICDDCHRPGHWAWYSGWDPYYSTCSVVDFRVNWSWYWGPAYWFGFVPYYVYVYRPTCPPQWHVGVSPWYSSWTGWGTWCGMWGAPIAHYQAPLPAGYTARGQLWSSGSPPPGYLVTSNTRRDAIGALPIGRSRPADELRSPDATRQPRLGRQPAGPAPADGDGGAGSSPGDRVPRVGENPTRPDVGRMPVRLPGGDDGGANVASDPRRPEAGRMPVQSPGARNDGGATGESPYYIRRVPVGRSSEWRVERGGADSRVSPPPSAPRNDQRGIVPFGRANGAGAWSRPAPAWGRATHGGGGWARSFQGGGSRSARGGGAATRSGSGGHQGGGGGRGGGR